MKNTKPICHLGPDETHYATGLQIEEAL